MALAHALALKGKLGASAAMDTMHATIPSVSIMLSRHNSFLSYPEANLVLYRHVFLFHTTLGDIADSSCNEQLACSHSTGELISGVLIPYDFVLLVYHCNSLSPVKHFMCITLHTATIGLGSCNNMQSCCGATGGEKTH